MRSPSGSRSRCGGPGIPRGVTIDPLVTNADLAPTIVEAAGVTPGLDLDGRSLLPVIQSPATDRNRDLLIEQPTLKAIRTPRYLYAEYKNGDSELYDLQNDPYELKSLARATGLRVSQVHASVPAPSAGELRRSRAASCTSPTPRLHDPRAGLLD